MVDMLSTPCHDELTEVIQFESQCGLMFEKFVYLGRWTNCRWLLPYPAYVPSLQVELAAPSSLRRCSTVSCPLFLGYDTYSYEQTPNAGMQA